jgi:hypothetical protein
MKSLSMGGTMNLKLLFAAFALGVIGAGWFAGAGATAADLTSRSGAASSRAAAAVRQPELDLFSADPRLGVKAGTGVAISVPAVSAEVEKVTLYVPAGYNLNLTAPPGTSEGHAFMGTASDFGFGALKAADPAAYVNSPQAQACAPGPHAAVWTMHLEFLLSDTAVVPIYMDPTSGDEATLGAYKLQACLPLSHIASPGGSPLGSRMRGLALEFTRFVNPTSAADYVWRAFVSNPDASGSPDLSTTYELRSDMPLPTKLTLSGKFDRRHHRALLNGRLTTQVSTVSAVGVTLYRRAKDGSWTSVTSTRTSANGSFRFVRPLAKTSVYAVEIWAIGDCNGDSTAPNGCVNETRGSIDSRNVRIVVRRH